MQYDVIVIGAGVVGSLIARELTRTDAKVLVIEKGSDVASGQTKANSAICHAGFDAKEGTLKARFNVEGSEKMEGLCRDLGVKYRRNGALVAGFSPEDLETLRSLKRRGEQNGVRDLCLYTIRDGEITGEIDGGSEGETTGEVALKENGSYRNAMETDPQVTGDPENKEIKKAIVQKKLKHARPDVSCLGEAVTAVLYAPTSGILCPYELCIAAMGNAMDNGAEILQNAEVIDITGKESIYEVKVMSTDMRNKAEQYYKAKILINAAGICSDKISRMSDGPDFTIHPRKGEYMLLDKDEGIRTPYTVFRCPSKMGKGVLVTPTVDGNLLIGPTALDQEDPDDTSVTGAGLSDIRMKASEQVRNIDFSKVITSFAGVRATGSTGDFIIERTENGEGSCLITLGGIESPGLSASPAIAEYVLGLLKDICPVTHEIQETRKPTHWFQILSKEEKNEVIRENPSYGHVVCRCEGVTEGEIIEAIHRNPGATDVDSIKRRTRSGMGRCQGGFCQPLVVEILARELGKRETDITKFGRESFLTVSEIKKADGKEDCR